MTEPAWQQARLIPTSGINGAQEQERRATSALLAVMTAVKEYGRTLTKGLGAHAGDIEAREPGCGIMLVMLQAGRRACSVVAAQDLLEKVGRRGRP